MMPMPSMRSSGRQRHTYGAGCPACAAAPNPAGGSACRYAPANHCKTHPAFEADNCPGCGTAPTLGRRT